MKKLPLLFAVIVMLSACSEESINRHERLFEHLSAIETLSADVSVTARYSDRSAEFAFNFTGTGERSDLTLTAPAEIEGIAVTLDKNGTVIGYEGVSVTAGSLDDGGTNPAEMLPKLVYLWKNVTPFEMGSETIDSVECLSAAWNDGGMVWRTWFSSENNNPVAAEVLRDGSRVLFAKISNVEITLGSPTNEKDG